MNKINKAQNLYQTALEKANANEEKKEVAELLEKAYSLGSADAAYALGSWYLYGEYFQKNIEKAITMLLFASENGSSDASFELGVYYETKKDVINLTKAFYFYTKAALQGDSQSFYEVGRLYYYGIGCEENKKIAEIWLNKAKELGID